MWTTKSKIEFSIKCLSKWGYSLKDLFTWVKVDKEGNLSPAVGRYLDHASEICLLGIKGRVEEFPIPVRMGLISDVIVAPRET